MVCAGGWSFDVQIVWDRAFLFVVRVFMHQFSPVQCEPRQLRAANLCLLFVQEKSFGAHTAWAPATLVGTSVSLWTPMRKIFPAVCACGCASLFDAHAAWAPAILFGTGVSLLTPMRQILPTVCACLCASPFDAHAAWALAVLFGTGVSLLTPMLQIFACVCGCVSLLTPMRRGLRELFLGRASVF